MALVTLTVLEVVLGIDNVIFISILAGKLPKEKQEKARRIGLMAAMGMRILLLMSIAWITRLTAPLFTVMIVNRPVSGRDLILIIGGLFLLFKATREIHDKLEGEEGHVSARVAPTMAAVITQIMLLDIVFSLDSVITAVGMADDLSIMVAAVVIAVGIMMFSAGPISVFVDAHPTVKVLALSFLLLIGCVADRRRLRRAHSEGLHLLCDGLLGVRRDGQPENDEEGQARRPARRLSSGAHGK